ncbi:MAG TPA: endonuclease/exonuclease/phosphatase family protein [Actinomycetales bacterium]|nr:endonuclease/exonuclease/phosphatase family protein [Actinomycetales bacterium]
MATYNVRDLRDDRDAVTAVLRSLRCDVLCLQEVPRRWFERSSVSRLAREAALRWVCGGRPSGGTAVFVSRRVDVLDHVAFRLPVPGPFTRTRGAAAVTVALDGASLTAVSVHLPLDSELRETHARIVRARVAAQPTPAADAGCLVLAGDLNEPPGGPAWAVLGAGLRDVGAGPGAAPTFPALRPRRRIDALFVGDGPRVTDVRVPGSAGAATAADEPSLEDLRSASDHLPVVIDLVLPVPGRG